MMIEHANIDYNIRSACFLFLLSKKKMLATTAAIISARAIVRIANLALPATEKPETFPLYRRRRRNSTTKLFFVCYCCVSHMLSLRHQSEIYIVSNYSAELTLSARNCCARASAELI